MATAASKDIKTELDILEPRTESRFWIFSEGDINQTYEQKPLSFFGKVEFFSLVGDTVDSLSDDGKPLNVNELFGSTANIDSLVAVISRVASRTPDALQEAYCIFLGVPRNERLWAKDYMERKLTDEEGMEILEVFIDQNAEALKSFFDQKGKSLWEKIQVRFAKSAPVRSSKRTKPTQPRTAE